MSYAETSHAASVWAAYLARERRRRATTRRPGGPEEARPAGTQGHGPGQPRPDRGAHAPGDGPAVHDEPAAA